jgi:nucleoside-diphosphate-sugar epimerase
MPVIVIGGDHPLGLALLSRLNAPDREVRAFVSSLVVAEQLKSVGIKVAIGDVSDVGHLAGACLNCHTAVLLMAAAGDGREISFASSEAGVFSGWAESVREAGVKRVIWVGPGVAPTAGTREEAWVDTADLDYSLVIERVVGLDEAAYLEAP